MWQVDMRFVVLCVRDCLFVLLDATFATAADTDSDLHLISLDVAGMMIPFIHS